MKSRLSIYFLLLFGLVASLTQAQQAYEKFGKNRVQYKNFDWKQISTTNFDIYYYSGGNEIAHNAARYAESDIQQITSMIGYVPRTKMTLIVYNSVSDMQQSNIGIGTEHYLGGETNFVKSKIELAFPGTQVEFRKEIQYKITKMLMNVMMFGGNLRETVQSSYMLNLPEWFISGLAAYIARKDAAEVHDYMYHFVKKRNKNPARLHGREAELAGHSLWRYIAHQYGTSAIPTLINLTRITHDEQNSIVASLSISYGLFLNEWAHHYEVKLNVENTPTRHDRIQFIDFQSYEIKHIALNPDTSLIAYSYESQGKQKIIIRDTLSGKRKTILVNHFKVIDQPVPEEIPLISWKSRNEISYITYKKGKPYYVLYDLNRNKRTIKKKFEFFDQILSFDHSPNNDDEICLSAVEKGQSDIFTYNFKKNLALRKTRDLYDDINPKYIPGSSDIIFSSNRTNDTLGVDAGSFDVMRENFDLFIFRDDSLLLERITNTSNLSEIKVAPISSVDYLMLVEKDFQRNLYHLSRDENNANQILPYSPSIQDFAFDDYRVHVIKKDKKENKSFSFPLKLNAEYHSYYTSDDINKKVESEKDRSYEESINYLLTFDLDKTSFDSSKVDSDKQDINAMLEELHQAQEDGISIYGPFKYHRAMGLDNFVTSVLIDPLRGLGIVIDANASELFSNHLFSADFVLANDLKSNMAYAKYDLLKYKLDYSAKLTRESLDIEYAARYNLTEIEFTAAKPFNQVSRFFVSPFFTNTTALDIVNLTNQNVSNNYLGYRTGFVFDNTSIFGLNMLRGTRGKATYQQYKHLSDGAFDFGELRVDVRHYQKIFDELTFAIRGSYGKYFGNNAKTYLLGGMDNWFLNNSDNLNEPPLSGPAISEDFLFLDFVTGLRGFNYNAQYGKQHVLFNAEVRVPVARLIQNKPIQSRFYKNLQIVGFYDIGTAWDDGNIFELASQSIPRTVDLSNGDKAEVNLYTTPFLSGYGLGLRSMVFGYYAKLDVAWGSKNYNTNKIPKIYLTLGYDF